MKAQPVAPAQSYMPAPPSAFAQEGALNKINMNIQGDRVHVDALLDHKGLVELEGKLQALKMLLTPIFSANDTGEA